MTLACGANPARGADVPSSPPKWDAHIDLEAKPGTKRSLGEGDLFLPLAQTPDTLLFGDLRMRFDDQDSREGNFGIGVRHMLSSGWNLGGYGYFDHRLSQYDHYFNQVTLGAEALGTDYDFRLNTYWPVGTTTREVDSLNAASISGTSVVVRAGEERALSGFDVDAGWRLPLFALDSGRSLRGYLGGYRFTSDGVDTVQGPRARIEFTMDRVPFLWPGSRFTLGAEAQHDDPRGTQAFLMARLRIPLQVFGTGGEDRLTAQERRMTDTVVRDVDIVTQAGAFGPAETATETSDGTTFTVLNSSSTTSLSAAVSALANNSTALLSGTFSTASTVDLTGNKSLMAGSVTVRSPSGRTAVLSSPATISSTVAGGNTIQAPGNNNISGLTINVTENGNFGRAIALSSTGGNYNILNNTITMTQSGANGLVGVSTDRNTNVVIRGNSFTLTGGTTNTALGLSTVGTTTVTVSGNTLNVSGATTNIAANVGSTTINAGSTGNVLVSGSCTGTPTSGSIGFTDGSTCP